MCRNYGQRAVYSPDRVSGAARRLPDPSARSGDGRRNLGCRHIRRGRLRTALPGINGAVSDDQKGAPGIMRVKPLYLKLAMVVGILFLLYYLGGIVAGD